MKTLYNLNDIHAGVVRSGGTTPFTSFELRKAVLQGTAKTPGLKDLLSLCMDGDLIINGDLLDTKFVPMADLWEVVATLARWLSFPSHITKPKLYLVRGNHDADKNALVMSSFDILCKMLESLHPEHVVTIKAPTYIGEHDAWVIPHLQNQDLFNAALEDLTGEHFKLLFVHVNYDNKFAVEADHSLNMSVEQAKAVPCDHIIFGHEHQHRTALDRKVLIVGNQIPTSIADCLGNDEKFMLRITAGAVEWVPVWQAKGDFKEMDWHHLSDDGARFIRVVGAAAAAEAGDAISAISRFRSKSKALIITNAVKVEGVNDQAEMSLNAEQIAAFDVHAALMEIFDPAERTVIERLLATGK